jgi:hypothetical protein
MVGDKKELIKLLLLFDAIKNPRVVAGFFV